MTEPKDWLLPESASQLPYDADLILNRMVKCLQFSADFVAFVTYAIMEFEKINPAIAGTRPIYLVPMLVIDRSCKRHDILASKTRKQKILDWHVKVQTLRIKNGQEPGYMLCEIFDLGHIAYHELYGIEEHHT